MKADEAQALVAGLVAAFPEAVVGQATLAMYARFLCDVDPDAAARAVATWVARENQFPTIAQLRLCVDSVTGQSPPDVDEAYAEVHAAAKRGRRPEGGWSHPAVKAAVDAVGFDDIRTTTTPGVERGHFYKAYEAARKRTADTSSKQLVDNVLPEMRELMRLPSKMAESQAPKLAAEQPRRAFPPPPRKKP